jgi:hypothetical protein
MCEPRISYTNCPQEWQDVLPVFYSIALAIQALVFVVFASSLAFHAKHSAEYGFNLAAQLRVSAGPRCFVCRCTLSSF